MGIQKVEKTRNGKNKENSKIRMYIECLMKWLIRMYKKTLEIGIGES